MSEFKKYIFKKKLSEANIQNQDANSGVYGSSDSEEGNPDSRYFNIINPESGFRYNIPMLSTTDPAYFYKYVYYMKLKERSPEAFNKIINWD